MQPPPKEPQPRPREKKEQGLPDFLSQHELVKPSVIFDKNLLSLRCILGVPLTILRKI